MYRGSTPALRYASTERSVCRTRRVGCNVRLAGAMSEPAGGIVPKRRTREGDEPVPPLLLLPKSGIRRGRVVTRRFKPPGPPPLRWCPGGYRGEIRFGDRLVAGRFAFTVR